MKGQEIKQFTCKVPGEEHALELVLIREVKSNAYFALESSYVLQEAGPIYSPYNSGVIQLPNEEPGMVTYTAFCRHANGEGTTWIDRIEAPADDLDAAKCEARLQCAEAWSTLQDDVECIGLVKGDIEVAGWFEEYEEPETRYFRALFNEGDEPGREFLFALTDADEQTASEFIEALRQERNHEDAATYFEISERQYQALTDKIPTF